MNLPPGTIKLSKRAASGPDRSAAKAAQPPPRRLSAAQRRPCKQGPIGRAWRRGPAASKRRQAKACRRPIPTACERPPGDAQREPFGRVRHRAAGRRSMAFRGKAASAAGGHNAAWVGGVHRPFRPVLRAEVFVGRRPRRAALAHPRVAGSRLPRRDLPIAAQRRRAAAAAVRATAAGQAAHGPDLKGRTGHRRGVTYHEKNHAPPGE